MAGLMAQTLDAHHPRRTPQLFCPVKGESSSALLLYQRLIVVCLALIFSIQIRSIGSWVGPYQWSTNLEMMKTVVSQSLCRTPESVVQAPEVCSSKTCDTSAPHSVFLVMFIWFNLRICVSHIF